MSGEETKSIDATGAGAPNATFGERSLEGRHVLVTGGTRGIGRALAVALAKRGAKVIICGRKAASAAAAAEAIAAEAGGSGAVEGVGCDQGDLASIKAMMEHIKATYKHLDVLINNAAIMPGFAVDPVAVSDEDDLATFQINLIGSHFVTKYALPLLFAQPDPEAFERTVLFTSSCAGWLTEPTDDAMLAYRATKAGQHGTMVGLAKVYARGIEEDAFGVRGGDANKRLHRVAAVHPGVVQTALGHGTALEHGQTAEEDPEAFARSKSAFGAITVEEGADTLLWLTAAKNGVVNNGKHYYLRAEHSF